MEKKSIGFGSRGLLLVIYQFLAFSMYCSINNIGQNIHANVNQMFGWNYTSVSTIYTIVSLIAVVIQFAIGKKIANSGKVKIFSIIFMILSAICAIGMATITSSETIWLLVWGLAVFFSIIGATFMVSTIVGQWFPRRKGTVMGIATLAFPVVNGIGLTIFGNMLGASHGNLLFAWMPWLILDVIGIVICALFITEYPEQCGAFPDNDRNMTPEAAKALMEQQAAAKKNSVWGIRNITRTPDFWLITIPQGILLLGSVGAMTQVMALIGQFGFVQDNSPTAVGAMLLLIFAGIGCFGSWILGVIDTRFGTKTSILLSCIFMIISAVLCFTGTVSHKAPLFIIGFAFLQIFMGASSNFTVSTAAQYWRREDFPSAFSFINPLANLICAFGPMIIAGVGFTKGFHVAWVIIGVLGVIALVCTLVFKPARILARDRQYRREAGLPEEGLSKSNAELMGEK
ncbi:MAG: MFS transporter [Eubacterium sp.]|nr:MFS transporter [Eubacterium sp.]